MLFSPSPRRRRLQLRISERRLLLMMGDALAVVASVLIALRIWAFVARYPFTTEFVLPQSHWFVILAGLWLLLASANDFYDLRTAARRLTTMRRLLWITFQMLVVYLLVFFLSPPGSLPRLFILYFGVSSFLLIGLWRVVNPALLGWASEPRHVLIVGTDWAAEAIIGVIGRYAYNEYAIKGIIGERDDVGLSICDVPVIGAGADILNYIYREHISELIVTSTRELSGETFQGVMDAYERGINIIPMPLVYERITGRVPVEHVNSNWAVVLPIDGNSMFNPYPVLKRLADVLLASIGMVVFLLLLPFLAVLIRLDSPGSIFYGQERVGLNGRIFRIYKFRSMVADAEQRKRELLDLNQQDGPAFKLRRDPRITWLGRLLRITSIDELPQLWNCLKGDMSLVGPRPLPCAEAIACLGWQRRRLDVTPGLTCIWQVQGRSKVSFAQWVRMDLRYAATRSLLSDLGILLRTVPSLLLRRGW